MSDEPTPPRILLVQADRTDRRDLREALGRAGIGYDITECTAPEGAIECLERQDPPYDLVIVESTSPSHSVLDVCKRLVGERPQLPVVMIAASGCEQRAADAIQLGVSDYLIKDAAGGYLKLAPAVVGKALHRASARPVAGDTPENPDLLGAIVDGSSDAIAVTDLQGRFVLINETGARWLDRTPDQIIGHTEASLYPADVASRITASDLRVSEGDPPSPFENTIIRNGVTLTYVANKTVLRDKSGIPIGIIGIAHDITERKRMEDALRQARDELDHRVKERTAELVDANTNLRESEERFRQLVENTNHVFWLTDWNSKELLYVNPAYEDIYGRTRESLYEDRRSWLAAVHPDDRARVDRTFAEAAARGQLIRDEYRIILPDGSIRWIRDSSLPIHDDDGEVYRWVGLAEDITERTESTQKMRALEEQLRHAQKMEAVGQLASGVAHDFGNLLSVISTHVLNVRSRTGHDDSVRASLTAVQEAVNQARGVTNSLLTFTHKAPTRRKTVDLNTCIRSAAHMLVRALPPSIELIADTACEPAPWISADPTQLQQVALNLAVNARDAMPDGGTLRISVARAEAGATAVIEPPSGATPRARLVVADTGFGMSHEVRERIFEPFFTTKPRGKGTGLGLAIVHSIAEEHGGRITVQSNPGEGTTISIDFPCLPAGSVTAETTDADADERRRGATILLAEHHPQIRRIVSATLVAQGYRVLQAADGEGLVDLYERHQSAIQMFVLDVELPDRSALNFLRGVRDREVGTPAIVITGHAGAHLDDELHGDALLLCKPFQMSELARLVRRTLEGNKAAEPQS